MIRCVWEKGYVGRLGFYEKNVWRKGYVGRFMRIL